MHTLNFKVDGNRCTRCGACVADCPSSIIKQIGKDAPTIAPEAEADCIACQHCLAVCPPAAISIFGRDPDRSLPLLPDKLPSLEQETLLLRGRRSVRHYYDENVKPGLINQLLATVADSPSGVNNQSLTFTVIDDRQVMARFREATMHSLDEAKKTGAIPERASFLADAVDEYYKNGGDMVFRGAPHLLIVSASPDAPCPSEDIIIALSYFEVLAASAGMGTVWCGMLKWALELRPELKQMIGLPEKQVFYPMLFGLPKVRYARTVQREDSAAVKRLSLYDSMEQGAIRLEDSSLP